MTTIPSPDLLLPAADALYRLGAGIDDDDAAMIASALTEGATLDFGPAARAMGIDFPVLSGRDLTAATLSATVGKLITTHAVTNVRLNGCTSDRLVLRALVEAAHFPPGDRTRQCIMKNVYRADLALEAKEWRIARLTVTCSWWTGDPQVLLGA
jgi:hypothetical protein